MGVGKVRLLVVDEAPESKEWLQEKLGENFEMVMVRSDEVSTALQNSSLQNSSYLGEHRSEIAFETAAEATDDFSDAAVDQVVSQVIANCQGLKSAMDELEIALIRSVLSQQNGNRAAAARQLKMPRQTLQDRIKKHGIE